MSRLLDNYQQLVARIDALCQAIDASLGEQITCSEGCSSCCTAITLFPVEAAALQAAGHDLVIAVAASESESTVDEVAQKLEQLREPRV